MEAVYTIIIFVIPGLLVRRMRSFFIFRDKKNASAYEELFQIAIEGGFITLLTVMILNISPLVSIKTLDDLLIFINSFRNMMGYVAFAFVIAGLYLIFHTTCLTPCFEILRDFIWNTIDAGGIRKYLKVKKQKNETVRQTGTVSGSMWEYLLYKTEYTGSIRIVEILHDGEVVTRGRMRATSLPTSPNTELLLEWQRFIEFVFKRDEKKADAEKILFNVLLEYIDTSTGYCIRLYDDEKLLKYQEQLQKEFLEIESSCW